MSVLLPRLPIAARRTRRAALALAVTAALAGCTSKADRAAQYDALADQMLGAGAFPAAAGTLQRALKLDSNNADRWTKMGRAQREIGQLGLAATSYQRALDLAPDNVEALQALSVLLVRGGQYDLAKSYTATLSVLAPDDIGGLLAQGAIALHEQRLLDADHLAERLMTLAPSLTEGFILKARVLEAREKVGAAADLLSRRLAFDHENADLAAQVLRLDRKAGNREGVRSVALQLARLRPDDPRYQLEAVRTLRARGKAAESDRLLARVAKRWQSNPQVALGVSHQWLEVLPHDAAVARIAELAAGGPELTKAALGTLLIQVGEPARAEAMLRPALGPKVNGDTADLRAAYADAALALGRIAVARQHAEQVLAFDERNVLALLVRAQTEAAAKDFRHALDDAQLAMAEEPQNRDAALLVARFWAGAGNAMLADKAFGTAQDRFPDDFGIHRERIGWLIGQGRSADAAGLATSFANQHGGLRAAVTLMAEACAKAADPLCSAAARRRLARG